MLGGKILDSRIYRSIKIKGVEVRGARFFPRISEALVVAWEDIDIEKGQNWQRVGC